MPKPDIRRYTSEQIDEMNRRGEVVRTPDDAPIYELSEREQEAFREGKPITKADPRSIIVQLELKPETFVYFDGQNDAHGEISRVLDEYARSHAKRAS